MFDDIFGGIKSPSAFDEIFGMATMRSQCREHGYVFVKCKIATEMLFTAVQLRCAPNPAKYIELDKKYNDLKKAYNFAVQWEAEDKLKKTTEA